jgi:hypothetical protein
MEAVRKITIKDFLLYTDDKGNDFFEKFATNIYSLYKERRPMCGLFYDN